MIEQQTALNENHEKERSSSFRVTVIGPACSGKTTILSQLKENGYYVATEPENPMMAKFIENPNKYAFQNQVYKSAQLMEQEIRDSDDSSLSDPSFRESGLLATVIYNRYLKDQGLITEGEFEALDTSYRQNMLLLPKPDLVVYLHADDETIKSRALARDGVVAHDPSELFPYWEDLRADLEERGVPIYRINTGDHSIDETQTLIIDQVERMKQADPTEQQEAGAEVRMHHHREPELRQDVSPPVNAPKKVIQEDRPEPSIYIRNINFEFTVTEELRQSSPQS